MVNVTYIKGKSGEPISLQVLGHALYGKPGEDVVCSALSILTYTAMSAVESMEKKGWLTEPPVMEAASGTGYLSFSPKANYRYLTEMQMAPLSQGFSLLAKYYPKFVKYHCFVEE